MVNLKQKGPFIMRRQSIEDYQRERREREAQASHTTPGDEERKERVKAHGRDCLRRVKGDATWEDWLGIGAAMMDITEEALAEVGVAVWDGNNKRLTKEFTRRWEEYEASAAEPGSNEKPLSKQERWALREVMTNPEIGIWRAGLDGPNRRKLNHPNRVIDRWKRATQTSDREPKKPSPSMSEALKERGKVIAEQDARIKELEEELEGKRDAGASSGKLVCGFCGLGPKQVINFVTNPEKTWGICDVCVESASKELQKARRKAKRQTKDVFKQAEDDMNAALGGLMKDE
jgi:hypothetical protein